MDHIKEVVAAQQTYAKASGSKERVQLTDLVENSLSLNASSLQNQNVAVVRQFAPVPAVRLEKHKVLQILVNLVRNAAQACASSAAPEKRLTLAIAREAGHLHISVANNGVGIPAENLPLIFGHGFTTKKDGHGFGLHTSALAAKEMGGSLTVHSEGAGKGARFTLDFPARSKALNGAFLEV